MVNREWWRYLLAGVKILVVGERQVRGALVKMRGGGGGGPLPVSRGYNSARVMLQVCSLVREVKVEEKAVIGMLRAKSQSCGMSHLFRARPTGEPAPDIMV